MEQTNNKEMSTEDIIAMRRIALYNSKAQNSGFKDFFGRDLKKERELEIERQKLEVVLHKKSTLKDINSKLIKCGKKNV